MSNNHAAKSTKGNKGGGSKKPPAGAATADKEPEGKKPPKKKNTLTMPTTKRGTAFVRRLCHDPAFRTERNAVARMKTQKARADHCNELMKRPGSGYEKESVGNRYFDEETCAELSIPYGNAKDPGHYFDRLTGQNATPAQPPVQAAPPSRAVPALPTDPAAVAEVLSNGQDKIEVKVEVVECEDEDEPLPKQSRAAHRLDVNDERRPTDGRSFEDTAKTHLTRATAQVMNVQSFNEELLRRILLRVVNLRGLRTDRVIKPLMPFLEKPVFSNVALKAISDISTMTRASTSMAKDIFDEFEEFQAFQVWLTENQDKTEEYQLFKKWKASREKQEGK